MSLRRKVTTEKVGSWQRWTASPTTDWPYYPATYSATRYASTEDDLQSSSGHPYRKLGKVKGDIGGNFRVVHKYYTQGEKSSVVYETSGGTNKNSPGAHFLGNFWAYTEDMSLTSPAWPSPPVSTVAQLQAYGTTAIARVAPTSPLAGLTVALAELRNEGLPSVLGANLLKSRTALARSAGSEYLNYQFGWLPLISDIRDMVHSTKRAEELTRRYERNSGKLLRRRYDFPTVLTNVRVDEGAKQPVPNLSLTYTQGTAGNRSYIETTKIERWFEGAFTYYLPPFKQGGDNSKRRNQIRNYLYGTRVTPETLWNLTPWTWAIDWATNFGDVFKNIGLFANDGLVMPYGYMMETSSRTRSYLTYGTFLKSAPWNTTRPGPFTQSFTTVVKQRVKATPFGFGLDPSINFTGRQWAILSALGLSRGGKLLPI